MASVINLNRFRKAKKRVAAELRAAENRAAFGRTKEERKSTERERRLTDRELRPTLPPARITVEFRRPAWWASSSSRMKDRQVVVILSSSFTYQGRATFYFAGTVTSFALLRVVVDQPRGAG